MFWAMLTLAWATALGEQSVSPRAPHPCRAPFLGTLHYNPICCIVTIGGEVCRIVEAADWVWPQSLPILFLIDQTLLSWHSSKDPASPISSLWTTSNSDLVVLDSSIHLKQLPPGLGVQEAGSALALGQPGRGGEGQSLRHREQG